MDGLPTLDCTLRPANWRMDGSHFHEEYEIYYLVHGLRRYFIKDHSLSVQPGTLLFINHRVLHRTLPDGDLPHERILLNFNARLLRRWQRAIPETDFTPLIHRDYVVVTLAGEEKAHMEDVLRRLLAANSNGDDAMTSLKAMELLILLVRAAGAAAPPRAAVTQKQHRVEQMIDYIVQNGYRVTLDELSEHFYISRYYLCRMFKEVSGMTLHEYLHSSRVLRAQELLEHSGESVTEIAQHAGFDTLTQFERIFKAYAGVSPRVYRQRQRATNE